MSTAISRPQKGHRGKAGQRRLLRLERASAAAGLKLHRSHHERPAGRLRSRRRGTPRGIVWRATRVGGGAADPARRGALARLGAPRSKSPVRRPRAPVQEGCQQRSRFCTGGGIRHLPSRSSARASGCPTGRGPTAGNSPHRTAAETIPAPRSPTSTSPTARRTCTHGASYTFVCGSSEPRWADEAATRPALSSRNRGASSGASEWHASLWTTGSGVTSVTFRATDPSRRSLRAGRARGEVSAIQAAACGLSQRRSGAPRPGASLGSRRTWQPSWIAWRRSGSRGVRPRQHDCGGAVARSDSHSLDGSCAGTRREPRDLAASARGRAPRGSYQAPAQPEGG